MLLILVHIVEEEKKRKKDEFNLCIKNNFKDEIR